MSYHINNKTLNEIQSTIEQYNMFKNTEPLILALSGGKDSLFAMLSLMKLGYKIHPVIIDMGYEENWGGKIVNIAKKYGVSPEVITIRSTEYQNLLDVKTAYEVRQNIDILDELQENNITEITPCTQCYNIKLIALSRHSTKIGVNKIVFGHHGTDAIVSFLKSCLMYIDRWDKQHESYNRENFKNLITEIRPKLCQQYNDFRSSNFATRISELLIIEAVSTDEPPIQNLKVANNIIQICRPLFNVFEDVIINYKHRSSLLTEGSGCGHSMTFETQTPRELIHYGLFREHSSAPTFEIKSWLLDRVKQGLNPDGTLKVNARGNRNKILGNMYKLTLGCDKII